jgi:hypothetical protein
MGRNTHYFKRYKEKGTWCFQSTASVRKPSRVRVSRKGVSTLFKPAGSDTRIAPSRLGLDDLDSLLVQVPVCERHRPASSLDPGAASMLLLLGSAR